MKMIDLLLYVLSFLHSPHGDCGSEIDGAFVCILPLLALRTHEVASFNLTVFVSLDPLRVSALLC